MKENTSLNTPALNSENNQITNLKAYKKPELTVYGSIAELVLANPGSGADGSGFPPVSLT